MPNQHQPAYFIPHGGGPCFFMDDPADIWTAMATFLRRLPAALPSRPKAIIIVSGHWETDGFLFTGAVKPPLIYDYYGFPAHTYQLRYDVPGDPELAMHAAALLGAAGLPAGVAADRGLDHGVFVPMKVALPDADIPIVEMSLDRTLDPALHIAAGRALSPLREQGILLLGAGMSFHNMRGFGNPQYTQASTTFDQWLDNAVRLPGDARATALTQWEQAPGGRLCHPREEHLLPLMVAAGASNAPGERVYSEQVLGTAISAFRFD